MVVIVRGSRCCMISYTWGLETEPKKATAGPEFRISHDKARAYLSTAVILRVVLLFLLF